MSKREFIGTVERLDSFSNYGIRGANHRLRFQMRNAFGAFKRVDIGKQVWRIDGVLQIENEEQRDKRRN